MKFVIDASAIIAVIANEPSRDKLIEFTKGADLISPASIHWEIGNAFSAMIKRGRISLDQACKAIQAYRQIPIRFVEVGLEESLAFVSKYQIYAYDAYLIQCGLQYQAPLITLDGKLAKVSQAANLAVVEVDP